MGKANSNYAIGNALADGLVDFVTVYPSAYMTLARGNVTAALLAAGYLQGALMRAGYAIVLAPGRTEPEAADGRGERALKTLRDTVR